MPTRRAISPRFAIRIDFNGSIASFVAVVVVVLFHLRLRFGIEVAGRRARSRVNDDIAVYVSISVISTPGMPDIKETNYPLSRKETSGELMN